MVSTQYPLMRANWSRIKHFHNILKVRETRAFCYHFELLYSHVCGDRNTGACMYSFFNQQFVTDLRMAAFTVLEVSHDRYA